MIMQGLVGSLGNWCVKLPPGQWHLGEGEAQGLTAEAQIGILLKLHLTL